MKKLSITLIIVVFILSWAQAQEPRYLVIEFIKVETGQMYDFIEHKDFMQKVYQVAVNDKKITGWDFWSLQSGADSGEFQYITITYYKDPVSMMNGISDDDLVKYAMIAYPHLGDKQIRDLYGRSLLSRDLAQRSYMAEIATTKDNFKMSKGVLASFDLMKAVEGRFDEYEKAEREVFLPIHQKRINRGLMGSWSLLRTALPFGSEAKSTHLTINLYKDYLQFFNAQEFEDLESTAEQRAAEEKGLKSRDQKWVYLATLENLVR
ncbi:hypothetical protein P872_18265 [Rhodonellum psychrophilum GCM71 = DSM 17998]|uniref:NIPSNAP domain-containing protein n=2 Tax=Rhodonellum TaxID=336827 RepID=U5BWX6_9BACT|nr:MULTISPECIES: hypothetical protein [Rhodonellum]ERM82343.1 hypothetical protein P872_18265 [Rhodonellum psychrophilum GCM71 = DSM 17998]SDZ34799.1 hypothetical protein SAMN05444412_1118 [Rhodonellum ikkaensis]